jgi:hypothetical protein
MFHVYSVKKLIVFQHVCWPDPDLHTWREGMLVFNYLQKQLAQKSFQEIETFVQNDCNLLLPQHSI